MVAAALIKVFAQLMPRAWLAPALPDTARRRFFWQTR